MKKTFITGLVILLPIAVTILLVRFFFNLLTKPFVGAIGPTLAYFHLGEVHPTLTYLVSQVLILVVLFLATLLIGTLTRWFFVHSLITYGERLLQRVPLISPIYNTCREVIKTIFSSQETSFKQVVLVPFPSRETLTIGFVTRDEVKGLVSGEGVGRVAVFVPTTPNPTSGFLVLFKAEELVYLDMTVENAFKFIISCGVIMAPFNPLAPKSAK